MGITNFQIDCVDINEAMLARGVQLADAHGVAAHIRPMLGNLNRWKADANYGCGMANQSLHHVTQLESLFSEVKRCLTTDGIFIVSDMIGRNGHALWPEARQIVDEYWAKLTAAQKFNHLTNRTDITFRDNSPTPANFEGIRAQDILPLLTQHFHFTFFYGFSNVIAPFISRAYGANWDMTNESHLQLIDEIADKDDACIRAGNIKPTQLLGVLTVAEVRSPLYVNDLSPQSCIRKPLALSSELGKSNNLG